MVLGITIMSSGCLVLLRCDIVRCIVVCVVWAFLLGILSIEPACWGLFDSLYLCNCFVCVLGSFVCTCIFAFVIVTCFTVCITRSV